jgi:SnoaL-like domain
MDDGARRNWAAASRPLPRPVVVCTVDTPNEEDPMTNDPQSPAVAAALAYIEAWSNHDFDTACAGFAADITVTATTTHPQIPDAHLAGVDECTRGLVDFAQTVLPGSGQVIASVGDERNALVMMTVVAQLDGRKATLPAARLYLLDEDNKIKAEQIIFYAPAN